MTKPRLLNQGDKIGIVAPSRMITKDQITHALEVFEEWGLIATQGKSLLEKHGYFAGTDTQRLKDLQFFIDNPEIKAIFCARGGYGMTRIVDKIDLEMFKANPKWIIGFSDITALHIKLGLISMPSIHGLMPAQFGKKDVELSVQSLKNVLFNGRGEVMALTHKLNNKGIVSAPIVGGNLSLIVESLGTKTEIDTEGKILFLEEVDEYLYKIDRMLNQLSRAGKLSKLAGLIVGDFSDMKDTEIQFGVNIDDLIKNHVKEYKYPLAFNFTIGHENLNLALPLNYPVSLSVDDQGSLLKFDMQ